MCQLNMAFVLMMDKTRPCVLYENTIECKSSNRQPNRNTIEYALAFKEHTTGIVAGYFDSEDSENIQSDVVSAVARTAGFVATNNFGTYAMGAPDRAVIRSSGFIRSREET